MVAEGDSKFVFSRRLQSVIDKLEKPKHELVKLV